METPQKQRGTIKRVLVTGAGGRLGAALTPALREKYGSENVIASDLLRDRDKDQSLYENGPFVILDVTNRQGMLETVRDNKIDAVVHLAGMTSVQGEDMPDLAWNINVTGVFNVLSVALNLGVRQVFVPSSIEVYGPLAPGTTAGDGVRLHPTVMQGVSKAAGELLCNYYVSRYGLDVRGIRYPIVVSADTASDGGIAGFAAKMFSAAVKGEECTCFVPEDARLPVMYVQDCVNAALMLTAAPFGDLVHHTDFNVNAMSISPGELAAEIRRHLPGFKCRFAPDSHRSLIEGLPRFLDDAPAREEWGWRPSFDIETMTAEVIEKLERRLQSDLFNEDDSLRYSPRAERPSYFPKVSAFSNLYR